MRNTLRDFKRRALARSGVRREYAELKEEFEVLDVEPKSQVVRVRLKSGLSQAHFDDESAGVQD